MPAPRVSVVVSSYERPGALGRLLDALAGQTMGRDEYEVIAVDNGSGPETARVLAAAQARLDLDLRVVHHTRSLGPAGGRNSGWRLARAPLIAFTDDDCRPASDWLAELVAAAAEYDPAARPTVIQGTTLPDPESPRRWSHTLFSRIVDVRAADGRFETCNILYSRELLDSLDGFDEGFLPHGLGGHPVGEDTDLGWRALALGAQRAFAPAAVVHHEVTDLGPLAKLAHQTRWGGAVHIFKIHPEAREILFRGLFWNVWHYMGWRALASLVGPRWLRRVILGRYLRAMRLRAAETGTGSWAVPYLIACDAAEAGALVIASLRERTPVL